MTLKPPHNDFLYCEEPGDGCSDFSVVLLKKNLIQYPRCALSEVYDDIGPETSGLFRAGPSAYFYCRSPPRTKLECSRSLSNKSTRCLLLPCFVPPRDRSMKDRTSSCPYPVAIPPTLCSTGGSPERTTVPPCTHSRLAGIGACWPRAMGRLLSLTHLKVGGATWSNT